VSALLASVGLGYLIGSFPTAYLAGRARGVDLRTKGSGNYGATNVYRNLGAGPAVVVLVVDVAKGLLPVSLLPRALPATSVAPATQAVLVAVAAVLGHVFSVFVGFRGGKGIGTAAGAYLALAPWATLVAAAVWLAVLAWRRIVSLASLCAAVALVAAVLAFHVAALPSSAPLVAVTVALSGFVFWTHRENLGRLRRGEEKPIVGGGR